MICRFKVKYQVLHKKKKGKITVLRLHNYLESKTYTEESAY